MNTATYYKPEINFLLLAIVQEQDVDIVERALDVLGVSITRIATIGGFLGRRNSSLVMGLKEEMIPKVLSILKNNCRQRTEYVSIPMEGSPLPLAAPIAVTVGGARVFIFQVERYEEVHHTHTEDSNRLQGGVEVQIKLLLTMVHDNESDLVTQALTSSHFRVTRVASTGGLLRRGMTTLLIGVEESQVQKAISVIRDNCDPSLEKKKKTTIFVLPVDQFEQV